eukprot:6185560-Pleurochrysis_carterae.AAC.2
MDFKMRGRVELLERFGIFATAGAQQRKYVRCKASDMHFSADKAWSEVEHDRLPERREREEPSSQHAK